MDPANTDPENIGNVKFGDSVSLSGTLQAVEDAAGLSSGNNYTNNGTTDNANGSVQLVLKLTRPLDMNLNGTQYRLTAIAVATSGLDDNGKSLIGRKADVKGLPSGGVVRHVLVARRCEGSRNSRGVAVGPYGGAGSNGQHFEMCRQRPLDGGSRGAVL